MHKVFVVVGSLRAESINRKFARALEKLGGGRFAFAEAELADLPMYNDDLWADPPASVLKLKADILAADAVLFVTPEYNRSLPPVTKNALDWASRPYGTNAWKNKPCAIVGATSGVIGTAVAQSHLRSIAPIYELIVMGQPEVYFTLKPGAIDDDHTITDAGTAKFLDGWCTAFDAWITRMNR
jgi:chromate reductase